MATYVVGDIHGCYDEWMKLKDTIEKQDSNAKFILVGDIVDRGPQVMRMIDWAMKNITPDGKYQMVIGNHEVEKIDWWNNYWHCRTSMGIEDNTGVTYKSYTVDRYDFKSTMEVHEKTDADIDKIIKFFESLPIYKELFIDTGKKKGKQHYIIVHGAVPKSCLNKDETFKKSSIHYNKKYNPSNGLKVHRNREQIIWNRNYCGNKRLKHTIVVHGHTPTVLDDFEGYDVVPGQAYFTYADINIDCGMCYEGVIGRNLCAVRLEDLEEFYVYNNSNTLNKEQTAFRNDMKHFIKGGKYINSNEQSSEEEWDALFDNYTCLLE